MNEEIELLEELRNLFAVNEANKRIVLKDPNWSKRCVADIESCPRLSSILDKIHEYPKIDFS